MPGSGRDGAFSSEGKEEASQEEVMALFRRGKWWWTDFSVNGQRFRQPLDTTDWREARAEEKRRITLAETGRLTVTSQKLARVAFSEAAERYMADGKTRWAPRTIQTERERSRPLVAFFGAAELRKITAESVRAYMAKWKSEGISNRTINRERDFLRGVLKQAKRWHLVAEDARPLPSHEAIGRALQPVEDSRVQARVAGGTPGGIKEVHDDIWLVSFMDYDLGYFDLETRVLEPLENPFGPKVLPMS
jgi:hypothetical protein